MTAPRPTVAVGAIVFDDRGRVLLVKRGRAPARGLWSLPGGKVDGGETLAAAVAREVLEETGVTVDVGALVEVVERIVSEPSDGGDDAARWHYVILDYLAHAPAGYWGRGGRGSPRPLGGIADHDHTCASASGTPGGGLRGAYALSRAAPCPLS